MTGCRQLIDGIVEAILDEQKAQGEYSTLARDVRNFICDARCPTGKVSHSMVESIATDEGKHEKMLTTLLELVRERCPISEFPVSDKEGSLTGGLGALFG
jgi:hypothetical protein